MLNTKILSVLLVLMLSWGMMDFTLNLAVYWAKTTSKWSLLDKSHALSSMCWGCTIVTSSLFAWLKLSGAWERTLWNKNTFWFPFAYGLLNQFAYLAYYAVAENVDASRMAPLATLYMAIPVVYGLVFRGEPLSKYKCLGLFLAVGAMTMIGIDGESEHEVIVVEDENEDTYWIWEWIFRPIFDPFTGFSDPPDLPPPPPSLTDPSVWPWMLAVILGFGIGGIFSGVAGASEDCTGHVVELVMSSGVGYALGGFLVILTVFGDFPWSQFIEGEGGLQEHLLVGTSGVWMLFGSGLFYTLLSTSKELSVVTPLSAQYTLFTTLMGILFLKEPLGVMKCVGILASSLATACLTIKPGEGGVDPLVGAWQGFSRPLLRRVYAKSSANVPSYVPLHDVTVDVDNLSSPPVAATHGF